MKIAVINSSWPAYNLASQRITNKLTSEGHEIFYSPRADLWSRECQKAYFSVIFTWNLERLCRDVNILKQAGLEIEIGGPAATAMPEYIEQQTGIKPHVGLDARFEHVPGDYLCTFTSRGCPRDCHEFCLVPRLEGRQMIEYDDFPIPGGVNPYVCDNNILATSWGHQELVVKKLQRVHNLDMNSGFDDRIFVKNPDKYWALWSQLKFEAWRFAYDRPEQKEPIKFCTDYLHDKGINYRNIIVFCIVGLPGQIFDEAREKLQYLIDIGTSPYPMRFKPLDCLKRSYMPPGWEASLERLFSYYGVPYIWRKCSWEEWQLSTATLDSESKKPIKRR